MKLRQQAPRCLVIEQGRSQVMGFPIVIALLALSSWSVFATFGHLRRAHAGRTWWFAFIVLTVIGLVVGCSLAFTLEYQVSPRVRSVGFPIPLAFFRLEDGQWVDFVTPPEVMYPGLIANVVAVVAFALLPLLLASLASRRRHPPHDSHRA
jgi:hypothetical protein